MPGPIDVSGDFAVLDNTEVVTYRKLNSDGTTFTEIFPVNALGMARRHRMIGAESLQADTVSMTWHLKALDLNGAAVERGDRILDASDVAWVVETGELQVWKSTWRCETLQEAS